MGGCKGGFPRRVPGRGCLRSSGASAPTSEFLRNTRAYDGGGQGRTSRANVVVALTAEVRVLGRCHGVCAGRRDLACCNMAAVSFCRAAASVGGGGMRYRRGSRERLVHLVDAQDERVAAALVAPRADGSSSRRRTALSTLMRTRSSSSSASRGSIAVRQFGEQRHGLFEVNLDSGPRFGVVVAS